MLPLFIRRDVHALYVLRKEGYFNDGDVVRSEDRWKKERKCEDWTEQKNYHAHQ